MPEEKDLMTQVGESFGIQDAPQQDADTGAGDEGAEQQPAPPPEPDPGPSIPPDTADNEVQPAHRREPRELKGDKDQLFTDKPKRGPKGELLDKDGRVVAATRREKQLAYNLNRAQYAANQAVRENRALRGQMQHYAQLDAQVRAANLSPAMVREAIELRAMAEQNPVLAVRDIVARVLAQGVTMEQIFGNDAIPAINARVITNELDKRLGPIEQQHRQQQNAQRITEQAQVQMEAFVADHPYADTHGVEISNLVNQHGLTPDRAYFELRSWVERRGFDFSSPLRPQIEAAMQQQQRRGRGNGRQPSTPGAMRGVQPSGQVPTQNVNGGRGDFRANEPWKDIAATVFRELNSR